MDHLFNPRKKGGGEGQKSEKGRGKRKRSGSDLSHKRRRKNRSGGRPAATLAKKRGGDFFLHYLYHAQLDPNEREGTRGRMGESGNGPGYFMGGD